LRCTPHISLPLFYRVKVITTIVIDTRQELKPAAFSHFVDHYNQHLCAGKGTIEL
jgi:hypothetical protein